MEDDKIALFDLDGTIADFESAMKEDLAKISKDEVEIPEILHSKKHPDYIFNRMRLIKSQRGWWENLKVIESGVEIMKLCKKIGFNIHILTQGPKDVSSNPAWGEKYVWCNNYITPIIGEFGMSVVREGKGLHYGRVLVDDYPPFMLEWLKHRPRGFGLMPITEENKDFEHPQVFKYDYDNWHSKELEDKLKEAFSRESGKSIS